jgi:RNA polymerase sigma-54 factor
MQGQKQVLVQQQRLSLSPQLVQSIKLMAMPFADLRERILEESEKNPALEIVSDPFISADFPPSSWSGPEISTLSSGGNDEESDDHRDFIEGVLHRSETLQEHLLEQLGELSLPAPVQTLATEIIQNLDRDGFHIVPPAELSGGSDPSFLASALSAVQSLDPAGCATADFHESLVVQAKRLALRYRPAHQDPILLYTIDILEHHFELLEKGRPDALVKALHKKSSAGFTLDLDQAEEVFELIRTLDPFPGRPFDNSPGSFIAPDVIVRKTEGEFSVVINEEEIPVLGVAPFFMELEEGPAGEAATARDFARESVKEAQWFIHTLARRNMTILKLARALVIYQREFFLHGPAHVAPLRMKDIAEEIGMHEATVSRAANGKYLECEWGLFEIRFFFSNEVGSGRKAGAPGFAGSSPAAGTPYPAGSFSKQGVKEVIREIIAGSGENLSDQKIADMLETRGIRIARRTVAKYRGELTIKSSFER